MVWMTRPPVSFCILLLSSPSLVRNRGRPARRQHLRCRCRWCRWCPWAGRPSLLRRQLPPEP